jgi:hypothetical protein
MIINMDGYNTSYRYLHKRRWLAQRYTPMTEAVYKDSPCCRDRDQK